MAIETEVTTQSKLAYQVLDRFGLPTLFTLMLFGALVWVLRGQQDNLIQMTKENQIKIDMLTQIEKDDATIIGNQQTILTQLREWNAKQEKLEMEHRLMQDRERERANEKPR